MKRFHLILAALLVVGAAALPAVAQPSGGNAVPRSDHLKLWVDIRDKGAIPGSANATATTAALQAAIDSLKTRPPNTRGVVFVPADPAGYFVNKPIWCDQNNLSIVGEPRGGSALLNASTYYGPVLVAGLSRSPQGQALTSDHFFDLFGLLDASAASAAGQRFGLHVKETAAGSGLADMVAAQGNGPFSLGPQVFNHNPGFWADQTAFTLDWAVDWTGVATHDGTYFGMVSQTTPQPWYVRGALTPGTSASFKVIFATQNGTLDQGFNGGTTWTAAFSVPSTQTVHRLAFQVQFVNGANKALAWVDNTQVAVTVTGGTGSFATATGLKLIENAGYPFQIGPVVGLGTRTTLDQLSATGSAERKILGLRLASGTLYTDAGTGGARARIDSGSLNDLNTYFTAVAGTVAFFPFTDLPATVAGNRTLTVKHGDSGWSSGTSAALCFTTKSADENSTIGPLFVRDLTIAAVNSNAVYGEALVLGLAVNTEVDGCTLQAGANAISSWNGDTNYIHKINNCTLYGNNAAIYAYAGQFRCANLQISRQGRASIWLNFETQCQIDGIFFIDFAAWSEQAIRLCRGASLLVTKLELDNESTAPRDAIVYAEGFSADGQPALRLKDSVFSQGTTDKPEIVLHDQPLALQACLLDLDNLIVGGRYYPALVQVDGPGWYGTITMPGALDAPLVAPAPGYTGRINVRSVFEHHVAPPRMAAYNRGGATVRVTGPADGQYSEWRCTGSGEYGTQAPPAWQGLNPVDEGTGGLAVYFNGHEYFADSGHATQRGFWSDYAWTTAINGLFNGQVKAPPATVYAGLSTVRAQRLLGEVAELKAATSPGYARIATTWGAASGGVSATTADVTFTSTTGPWSGVRSIVLYDAITGGNILAVIEVAPSTAPLSVTTGGTLLFAAGTLTVRRTSHQINRMSCWTPYLVGKVHDFWLRGQPLPTAANLYMALSTQAADPDGMTLAEPIGNGYARAAFVPATLFPVAAGNTPWNPTSTWSRLESAVSLTFPTPTGSWGTAQSAAIVDAPSGGNVWIEGDMPLPRAIGTGAAPKFAAGAVWITSS